MHHSINGLNGIHNNKDDEEDKDEDEDENHQYQKQQPQQQQQQQQSSLKTTTLPHNNTQSLHARDRTLRYTTNDDDDGDDDEDENDDRNGSTKAYMNQSKRLDTPFLDNNPFSASAAGGQGLGVGVHNSTWGATTRPSGRGGVYDVGRDGDEEDQHVTHSYAKHHHEAEEDEEEEEEEEEEDEVSMTKQQNYGRVGRDGSDRELSYQSHQNMTSSYLDTNTTGGNGMQGGTLLGPPPRPRPQISTLSAAVRGRVINHHNPNNTSFGTMDTATSGGGYSGGGGSGGGGGGGMDIIRSRPPLSKSGGGGGGGRGNDSSLRGRSRSGSCDRGERGSSVSDRGGSVVSDTRNGGGGNGNNGNNGSKRSNSVNSRRHGHTNTINNNGNQQPGQQPGGNMGQRGFNRTTGTGIGSGGGSGVGSGINNGTGLPIGLPTEIDEMKRYLNSKAMELEAELATYKQENTSLRQLRKQQETTLQEVITYAIIPLLTFCFLLCCFYHSYHMLCCLSSYRPSPSPSTPPPPLLSYHCPCPCPILHFLYYLETGGSTTK